MDLEGNPSDHRVVVAMSGGVDSSVTAALLVEAGFEVVGLTMQLYDYGKTLKKKGACCAGSDINDARLVSSKLGIPHYVLNYESIFQDQVMHDFADSYLRGETPIPCIRCNQTVKFTDMFDRAKKLGASAMATGHYIRRKNKSGTACLYKGIDPLKDQSYFLFATTKKQLDFVRFPLGSLTKEETRSFAKRYDLNVADKPDSQDICFVPNGDYASVISKYKPQSFQKGDILSLNGEKLGIHDGIINYTIGQRKGIKISNKEPLYVIDIRAKDNSIIVGSQEYLNVKKLYLRNINILSDTSTFKDEILIKVRSTGKLLKAKAVIDGDRGVIDILQDEKGISPGQACVFYFKDDIGERVLGGGWIDKAVNKNLSPQLTEH